VAETSIFMIAGVLVGANVIHFQSGEIDIYRELVVSIYIYVCVVFVRFLSIGVFYRYLRKMGDGLNWKEIVVLTFAGLKGAIGISLAMLVFKNSKYDVIVSSLIMMHVTCNSLLTLVIHGTATNLIVKMLGVSTLKRVEYKFFQEYLHSFMANILDRKEKLKEEKDVGYEMIQW
jgi:NhaP-type Na+/H+ or K+/H+ antiporter